MSYKIYFISTATTESPLSEPTETPSGSKFENKEQEDRYNKIMAVINKGGKEQDKKKEASKVDKNSAPPTATVVNILITLPNITL